MTDVEKRDSRRGTEEENYFVPCHTIKTFYSKFSSELPDTSPRLSANDDL